mmetsp:Transcript_27922/g.52889  ORF Transcript_27922/g.52889 Transcript_27922/m.52889 type:complete len:294 (+) Transcript_27922:73-954(+)
MGSLLTTCTSFCNFVTPYEICHWPSPFFTKHTCGCDVCIMAELSPPMATASEVWALFAPPCCMCCAQVMGTEMRSGFAEAPGPRSEEDVDPFFSQGNSSSSSCCFFSSSVIGGATIDLSWSKKSSSTSNQNEIPEPFAPSSLSSSSSWVPETNVKFFPGAKNPLALTPLAHEKSEVAPFRIITQVSLAWVASTTAFEAPNPSSLFRTLQSSLVRTPRADSITKLVDAEAASAAPRSRDVSDDSEPFLDRERGPGPSPPKPPPHQLFDAHRHFSKLLNADQAASWNSMSQFGSK